MSLSRRKFLKVVGVSAGAATVGSLLQDAIWAEAARAAPFDPRHLQDLAGVSSLSDTV